MKNQDIQHFSCFDRIHLNKPDDYSNINNKIKDCIGLVCRQSKIISKQGIAEKGKIKSTWFYNFLKKGYSNKINTLATSNLFVKGTSKSQKVVTYREIKDELDKCKNSCNFGPEFIFKKKSSISPIKKPISQTLTIPPIKQNTETTYLKTDVSNTKDSILKKSSKKLTYENYNKTISSSSDNYYFIINSTRTNKFKLNKQNLDKIKINEKNIESNFINRKTDKKSTKINFNNKLSDLSKELLETKFDEDKERNFKLTDSSLYSNRDNYNSNGIPNLKQKIVKFESNKSIETEENNDICTRETKNYTVNPDDIKMTQTTNQITQPSFTLSKYTNKKFKKYCQVICSNNTTLENKINKFSKKTDLDIENNTTYKNKNKRDPIDHTLSSISKYVSFSKKQFDAVHSNLQGISTYIDKPKADLLKMSDKFMKMNNQCLVKIGTGFMNQYENFAKAADISEDNDKEYEPFDTKKLDKNQHIMKVITKSIRDSHRNLMSRVIKK
jgi:hypothetical protein